MVVLAAMQVRISIEGSEDLAASQGSQLEACYYANFVLADSSSGCLTDETLGVRTRSSQR